MADHTIEECPRCSRRRLAFGRLTGEGNFDSALFCPANFRRGWFRPAWSTGIRVAAESRLCVDCGFVWSSADLSETVDKLRRWGTPELIEGLGLGGKEAGNEADGMA